MGASAREERQAGGRTTDRIVPLQDRDFGALPSLFLSAKAFDVGALDDRALAAAGKELQAFGRSARLRVPPQQLELCLGPKHIGAAGHSSTSGALGWERPSRCACSQRRTTGGRRAALCAIVTARA